MTPMLEILHNHSNVVFQPSFDDPRYSGINPYALGFAMMEDIKRICSEPTKEDENWFPEIAGSDNWREVLKDAWANYRDESFIKQYLSPRLMRQFKMFALTDEAEESHYVVAGIHDERGYLPRPVLEALSERLQMPLAEILRVASFYNAFSLEPVGRHMIEVCLGTACFVRGSGLLLQRLEEEIGVSAGGTDEE